MGPRWGFDGPREEGDTLAAPAPAQLEHPWHSWRISLVSGSLRKASSILGSPRLAAPMKWKSRSHWSSQESKKTAHVGLKAEGPELEPQPCNFREVMSHI